jgi:UrcA family protein
MKTSSLITALGGSLALLAGAGLASAATPDSEIPATKVQYGDLDLHTDSGMRVLYRRLAGAAARVCPDPGSRDLTVVAATEACRRQAIARAARTITESQLVEIRDYRSKAG